MNYQKNKNTIILLYDRKSYLTTNHHELPPCHLTTNRHVFFLEVLRFTRGLDVTVATL